MRDGRATLDDVAALAGVSRMTVSNAYARPEVVAATTLERVLDAATQLSYGGPSAVGRTLRRGSTGVLGVLLRSAIPHAFSDPGAVELLRGIAQGADEAGLSLLVVHAAGPDGPRRVADAAVDAFIGWSLRADDPALVAAVRRRVRVVTTGSGSGLPGVPFVSADNARGGRQAAQHLLDVGCGRFAVVGADLDDEQLEARRAGWRAALAKAGVHWSSVVRLPASAITRQAGAAAVDAWSELAAPGLRWGLLAMTDVLALGALQRLREVGVDVPGDVAVVGFDDVEEAATSSPGLTTVHQDLFAAGRECALRAAGHLDEPTAPYPTTLVVRGSTVLVR